MSTVGHFMVDGYELALDRLYDPESNLWVAPVDGAARIGFDPLGAETTGDIVAISFPEIGTRIVRGQLLATVEAAKFVGPLLAPISGTLVAVNEALLRRPGVINAEPLATWVVELNELDPAELEALLAEEGQITRWFSAAVARFRRAGAIAQ
ncbi:MAG TPA: glycine cleavage system protein H [Solirubrobacteraceae bacterium]|nr:glycine cleavage system protein H [Solirubrobacteraceae bacterium]